MEFENLVCGNCGGTDFHKLSDLEYRCNHCHGLLVRSAKAGAPPKPVYYAEPEPIPVIEAEESPVFVKTLVGLVIAVFVIILVSVLITKKDSPGVSPRGNTVAAPGATPPPKRSTIKTEVVGKVKGSFGVTYIKCLLTNTGETVLTDPQVTLILYKNDIKLEPVYGTAGLKYLKPGETTPVWVELHGNEDYTSAVVEEKKHLQNIENYQKIFPELKFSDVAMKTEVGNSSFNDQIYREKFFTISGTLQNEQYNKVAPQLFAVYYNSKSEVVGVISESPPELMRGEKTRFEISAGETQLFGVPTRFEIIAVDPYQKSGPCPANKTC